MKKIEIDEIMTTLEEYTERFFVPILDALADNDADAFKILVATLLSARTNDKTTSKVVYSLFGKVKNLNDLSKLTVKEIENLIYPVGFYHQKAKHLKKLPDVIKERYNGVIPQTIEEMITLPGVGRKTANLVMILAFDKDAICVDVHVHRISNRLGYIQTKTPEETEYKLREVLPRKHWKKINTILVKMGQNTCKPINPKCVECPINAKCNQIGVK
jgi:endonuclease III